MVNGAKIETLIIPTAQQNIWVVWLAVKIAHPQIKYADFEQVEGGREKATSDPDGGDPQSRHPAPPFG